MAEDGNWYATSAEVASKELNIIFDLTAVTEDDFRPFTYDATANLFITLVRQYGAQYTEVDKEATGRGYVTFYDDDNKAAVLQAGEMLKDLFDTKVMGIPSVWNSLYCSDTFFTSSTDGTITKIFKPGSGYSSRLMMEGMM